MTRERRAHARVAIPLDVRAVVDGREVPLVVRELSRSGAYFYAKENLGRLGGVLTLKLAIVAGIKPLVVSAQLIRCDPDRNGASVGLAVRFVDLSKQTETALLDLLDRGMKGPGTRMRAYPRVSFLLDVRCTSKTELGALLRDIGEGGAGVEVDQPLGVGDEVLLDISNPGQSVLRLTGVVVSCEEVPTPPNRTKVFRLGLRFAKLSAELRTELADFLRKLYRR